MKYATLNNWSKAFVIVVLVLCMVISMTACGNADKDADFDQSTHNTTEAVTETTEVIESTEPTEEAAPTEATEETTEVENETEESEPQPQPPEETFVTMYTTSTLNYRVGPGAGYEKRGSLPKGTAVQVAENSKTDNNWYKVLIDGNYYYMSALYLSSTAPAVPDTNFGTAGSTDNSTGATTGPSNGPESSTPSDNTSSSPSNTPGTPSNSGSQATYVGPANTATGISWDGKSPIIYTYPDGTTGTEPKEGATFESIPGVITTVTTHIIPESNETDSADGVFHCEHCGKVCGDGSDGTCVRWLVGGNHTCTCCGETVPGHVCHTCDEE